MPGKDIFDRNPEVNSLESLVCFEMKHREVNTDYRKEWATHDMDGFDEGMEAGYHGECAGMRCDTGYMFV
jgi:hypothetical protein